MLLYLVYLFCFCPGLLLGASASSSRFDLIAPAKGSFVRSNGVLPVTGVISSMRASVRTEPALAKDRVGVLRKEAIGVDPAEMTHKRRMSILEIQGYRMEVNFRELDEVMEKKSKMLSSLGADVLKARAILGGIEETQAANGSGLKRLKNLIGYQQWLYDHTHGAQILKASGVGLIAGGVLGYMVGLMRRRITKAPEKSLISPVLLDMMSGVLFNVTRQFISLGYIPFPNGSLLFLHTI